MVYGFCFGAVLESLWFMGYLSKGLWRMGSILAGLYVDVVDVDGEALRHCVNLDRVEG